MNDQPINLRFPMWNGITKAIGVAMLAVMLSGCLLERAQVAQEAREQMIGLSKEGVLSCMGAPVNKAAEGQTEVWSYSSGNGRIQSSGFVSRGGDVVYGGAVSQRRFCNIDIVMTTGVVSRVNYSGPTGGLISQGEQCAYAVQNCIHR
jgi:hypothetical protein